MTSMTVTSRPSIHAVWIALVGLTAIGATDVGAVSTRVKFACARDYMANCRAYKPDSPETRNCMNHVGARLSPRCVSALVAAGEVTQAEVKRRASLGD